MISSIGNPGNQHTNKDLNVTMFNKSLASAGQVTIGFLLIVACLVSVHVARLLKQDEFWTTYAEIVFMIVGQAMTLIFFIINKDLRKHVKSRLVIL